MEISRRGALYVAVSVGLVPITGKLQLALADDKRHALIGEWRVRCPKGHIDTVTGGTKQHECDDQKCRMQCFVGGKVTVMCPKDHPNEVDLSNVDLLETYTCKSEKCGTECRVK